MTTVAQSEDFAGLFAPEEGPVSGAATATSLSPWKVLIVDDEADMHAVLHLALEGLVLEGRPLTLLDACSAAEARDCLAAHPDVALLLLDVVMENHQAGLELARYIREDLHNPLVQIVVVTGQPGYAPQRSVVMDYGINDYRLKSELTAEKIFTAACTSLRTHAALLSRQASEARLQLAANVFTHAREGIVITDLGGTIVEVNDAFCRISGYAREEILGNTPRLLKSGLQAPEAYAALWHDLIEKGHWYGELWNRRKNGALYASALNISTVQDAGGRKLNYVALCSDVTELKAHEQQLERLAHYDVLTHLPNRALLADRLQQGMAASRRNNELLGVVFLDLDGFKAINDRHGHDIGDHLLRKLARRMRQTLREVDTLARLGGDEFVAVLMDLRSVEDSLPMLNRLLTEISQPVSIGELDLTVSASLGVTFYPQDGNVDADQLIRQADQAMYQAKLAGKNRYHAFDMGQDVSIRRHHEGLERLRLALDRDEFVLHFQPKVNMCSGAVIGAEALIRWHHPEKGMLAPAAFLPLLEGHALAVELGEWVIDTALSELETWQGQGLEIGVSVNVGASQLQQADFVERLQHLLSRHPGVKPGSLSLEVLETSALGEIGLVSSTMRACRSLGVGFELDDFGTGYSSLTYLKHLPVATLKIDQSFVRDMLNEPDDIAILESVLDLSAAFDKTVIAEGVETLRQGELLLLLGCRLAQGYGIARPMPATDLPAWVARWQPDVLWQATRALSQDRRPLLRAAIKHHAWIHAISRYLRGESPSTPPLSPSACAFGKWLQSDSPIRQAIPSQVDTLHLEIHRDAAALLELQAQGRSAEAIAGIPHLQAKRDTLINALKSLL